MDLSASGLIRTLCRRTATGNLPGKERQQDLQHFPNQDEGRTVSPEPLTEALEPEPPKAPWGSVKRAHPQAPPPAVLTHQL